MYYKNNLGQYFIIQNTEEGSLNTALQISLYWQRKNINLGYRLNSGIIADLEIDDDPQDYPYVVFGISNAGTLEPIIDETDLEGQSGGNFLMVVSFGDRFSSMLRLA